MTTIRSLAAEFHMQPYEAAAFLDLDRDYDETAELDAAAEDAYREALAAGAALTAALGEGDPS